MRTIYIIAIVLSIFSCEKATKKSIDLDKENDTKVIIENVLKNVNINVDVSIIKDSILNNTLVTLSFKEPYKIIGNEFQDIFIAYIAHEIFKKKNITDSMGFLYNLDVKMLKEPRFVLYNQERINNLPFDEYPRFKELVEYCLLNFEPYHDVSFDNNINIIHEISPTITYPNTLFKLLLDLSKNKTPSLKNNGDVMFMTLYDYNLYILDKRGEKMSKERKELRELEIKYISDFWKIAKGRDIYDDLDFLKEMLVLKAKLIKQGKILYPDERSPAPASTKP